MRNGWSIARRLGGLAAVTVALAGLVGCSQLSESDFRSHDVIVQVQNSVRVPIEGVRVTAWIIDVDLAGPNRAPIELGPVPTDADGLPLASALEWSAGQLPGKVLVAALEYGTCMLTLGSLRGEAAEHIGRAAKRAQREVEARRDAKRRGGTRPKPPGQRTR